MLFSFTVFLEIKKEEEKTEKLKIDHQNMFFSLGSQGFQQ